MEDQRTPAQESELRTLAIDFERQLARVGVDLQAAMPQLIQTSATSSEPVTDSAFEETHTVDLSGIVATLRSMTDDAGTAAFVAAYNRRGAGFDQQAS